MDFIQIFIQLISKIYSREALAGSDMYKVTEIIEQLRSKFIGEKDTMQTWSFVDDTVARSYGKSWLNSILELREKFISAVLNDLEEQINEGFKQSEEVAWNSLRLQYFYIFKEWRIPFALKFLQKVSGKFSSRKSDILEMEQASILMSQRRWVEANDFILKNAKDESLGKDTQTHLYALASSIQLYFTGDKNKAKQYIQKGLDLSPNVSYIKSMDACFDLENDLVVSARKKYEEMVREDPNGEEGLNGIGDCYKRENEINIAEDWYNKAIAAAPGTIGAYQNKIRLYCSNLKTYEQKKELIQDNVCIQETIEPEFKYDTYIDTGYACQLVNDFPEAEAWFQKAINLNPKRVEGYAAIGHLYIQQLPPENEHLQESPFVVKAEDAFKKAISLGNKCFDGYWGLNILYQQLLKNDEAINVLTESYPLCPEFNEVSNIDLGTLNEKKGNWDKASIHFLKALEINPQSQSAIEYAEGFAERLCDFDLANKGSIDRIQSFYENMLRLKGPEWKEQYYTLMANAMNQFEQDETHLLEIYKEALIEFPGNASFQNSLDNLLLENKFGTNFSNLVTNPVPIAIECHIDICNAFLQEGKNEFRPEFLDKIEKFKSEFKAKFGITVPALSFRQFEWTSDEYNFYTVFDEVYTTLGSNIYLDKLLAMGSKDELEKAGIQQVIPITLYSPFIKMCWIDPGQSNLVQKANIELKEPLDLIFQHLLFQVWSQMKRFCNYDDTEISPFIENEDINTAAGFLQLLQYLLELHVPINDKSSILLKYKAGTSEGKNIQQIARGIIKLTSFKPVYPTAKPAIKCYKIDEAVEIIIATTLVETKNKQWAGQILPEDCQEILSAIRIKNDPFGRGIVSDDRMADILNNIAKLEFPYFEFRTKEDMMGDEPGFDDSIIEKIAFS
jgi:tetratricopeptide (TPR) repeat protein